MPTIHLRELNMQKWEWRVLYICGPLFSHLRIKTSVFKNPKASPKLSILLGFEKSKSQLLVKLWSTFAPKVNSITFEQIGWISFLPWLPLDICNLTWS